MSVMTSRLVDLTQQVGLASALVASDPTTSPALVTLMEELYRQVRRLLDVARGQEEGDVQHAAIAADQAAESAALVARAQPSGTAMARQVVLDARRTVGSARAAIQRQELAEPPRALRFV